MKIKNRLWAVGWISFLIGIGFASKDIKPVVVEEFSWFTIITTIMMFIITMVIGYIAGIETMKEDN